MTFFCILFNLFSRYLKYVSLIAYEWRILHRTIFFKWVNLFLKTLFFLNRLTSILLYRLLMLTWENKTEIMVYHCIEKIKYKFIVNLNHIHKIETISSPLLLLYPLWSICFVFSYFFKSHKRSCYSNVEF